MLNSGAFTMLIQSSQYKVEIFADDTYISLPTHNLRAYSREYKLGDYIASCYGITVNDNSCILLADGSQTSVHEHSALIIGDDLFVAIGNQICCITLPVLELKWNIKADMAACFGIYYSELNKCLISHGECEVACIGLDGKIKWSASGKDIFTKGFALYQNNIEAIDFNNQKYSIDIENGKISLTRS